MNTDNAVRSVLPDKSINGTGLRLGKRGVSELFAVDTIGCCEITIQIHAMGVETIVVGHTIRIGHR